MYGYGSYGHTVEPDFDYEILPLLDAGYIYVIAHIRGGSFLGYNWYLDGKMSNKINTFKDFIRCAEYLGDESNKYCDPKKINIDEWKNREDEGILFVEKAGELLYRLADEKI